MILLYQLNGWLEPTFLLWLFAMAGFFYAGNAYGQDKIRLQMKKEERESREDS